MKKRCTKCGIVKSLAFFGNDKSSKSGKKSYCRKCACMYAIKYAQRNRDKCLRNRRSHHLHEYYGISLAQYDDLVVAHNNVCAICKKPDRAGKRLAVDHCHKTRKIRGLLCSNCNTALGLMGEDVNLLHEMIIYLNKHMRTL